jgi:hypothetical protein
MTPSPDDHARPVEDAIRRMEAALSGLELVTARRLELEKGRGDLETELHIMQDDRARLAVDLDGAVARLSRVEGAAKETGARLTRAIALIRDILAGSAPSRV